MKNLFSYRWLIGAFTALFFALQSYSLAHASSYLEDHHDHDGVACLVTVIADDHIAIAPSLAAASFTIEDTTDTVYPDFTSALYTTPQGRAPPPRGPPSYI